MSAFLNFKGLLKIILKESDGGGEFKSWDFENHLNPYYNSLRVFGCRCFLYLKKYDHNKFEKKTYPCIFVGYNPNHNGYRCLDPKINREYISCHVVSDESDLPFVIDAKQKTTIGEIPELITFLEVEVWTNKLVNIWDL